MSCEKTYLSGVGSYVALQMVAAGEANSIDSGAGEVFSSDNITGDAPIYKIAAASESLNTSGDTVNSQALTSARTYLDSNVLNKVSDGSLDVELTGITAGYLAYATLGAIKSYALATNKVTMVYVPSITSLPKYDIYVEHGGGQDAVRHFQCMQVNSVSMDINSNSIVSMSMDWNGLSEAADPLASSAVGANSEYTITDVIFPTNLTDVNVQLASTGSWDITSDLESLSININNNLDTSAMELNGSGRSTITPQDINVTGTLIFNINLDDSTLLTFFKNMDVGKKGYASASGSDTYSMEAITIDYSTNLVDNTTSLTGADIAYEFKIQLQNLVVTNITHDVSGQGLVKFNIDFECLNLASDLSSALNTFPIYMQHIHDEGTAENTTEYYGKARVAQVVHSAS